MSQICPSRLQLIRNFLVSNPEAGERTVSKALNLPRSSTGRALRFIRSGVSMASVAAASPVPKEGQQVEFSEKKGEATLTSKRVLTLADLIEHTKVDLKVWSVERFVSNKFEQASKDDLDRVTVTPLFQVKAFFVRRAEAELSEEFVRASVEKALAGIRPPKASFRGQKIEVADPHMLEISIPDIHIGKLVWGPETGGASYDSKIATRLALDAAENLWSKACVFPISRILLPLGSDLFHTDTINNTTTAGTAVDSDSRWQKSFRMGVELAIELIEFSRSKTPDGVDVLMIPGNHDFTRTAYLGLVLEMMYRNCPDVRINNSPNPRKYFRFGTTLLGFTHGDKEKHDRLPLIMAGEKPTEWAETTHREIHLGHLHSMRETRYVAGNEHGHVRVRILPSLCATDSWHHSSGFVGSQRAAEAYIWAFKAGYVGHLSYTVPK